MEQGIKILYSQCYADEDYIGKIDKVAAPTHKLAMPVRALQRLSVLTSLELRVHAALPCRGTNAKCSLMLGALIFVTQKHDVSFDGMLVDVSGSLDAH